MAIKKSSADITLRFNKSEPLTHNQLDANFEALKQTLDDVESISLALSNYALTEDLNGFARIEDIPLTIDELNELKSRISELEIELDTANNYILELQSKHPEIAVSDPIITVYASVLDLVESENQQPYEQTLTIEVTTQNTFASENISWAISGTNIDTADFSSITIDGEPVDFTSLTGILTDATRRHIIVITVSRDEKTEADETFIFSTMLTRNSTTYTDTKSIKILDTSRDSELIPVTWPNTGMTLFDYLSNNIDTASMWIQDFDLSALKITLDEQNNIITDAKNSDTSYLIELGLTIAEIYNLIEEIVPVVVNELNSVVDNFFGSGTVVLLDNGTGHFGTYNLETLEFTSTNRKFVRDENPTYTLVNYSEKYNTNDLMYQAQLLIDEYISSLENLTEQQIADLRAALLAFAYMVITITVAAAEAMSTNVNLYGFRKLTPNT